MPAKLPLGSGRLGGLWECTLLPGAMVPLQEGRARSCRADPAPGTWVQKDRQELVALCFSSWAAPVQERKGERATLAAGELQNNFLG